jgi:hypothetical protein
MAITLQEAKVGMRDHIAAGVINEFQQDSLLLDRLVFDNAVAAGSSGSTLVYGYQQVQTPAVAGVRAINSEYVAGEAKRVEKTAKCVIMGGKFELDRVIIGTAGEIDELDFQTKQKVAATANEFHMCVINGTSAASGSGFIVNTFDGLKKLLAGTANEFTSEVDISTSAKLDANGQALLDELDKLIAYVPGCNMILMNLPMLLKVRSAARRAGYYERTKDDFGRYVETYNGIPMVDVGKFYNGSAEVDVIPTDATAGTTDIYAISIGLDGFHGISPQGDKIIRTYMPDLSAPGAVKNGEVELVAGVALKNSRKAGVLKGVQINPAS